MSRFDEKAWAQSDIAKLLKKATFITSAADPKGYPEDKGVEIGFAGRSNVGKSTCLNAITQQTRLAHASKTPGRTQLINFFELSPLQKLIDLPGYGYAKVPPEVKKKWAKNIEAYLTERDSLAGMVWLVDSRRELNGEDLILLNWLVSEQIETQILLCKIDKLSRNQGQQALHKLNKQLKELNVPRDLVSTQVYSSTSKEGLVKLTNRLAEWFARVEELDLPVTPQDEEPNEHI
ncbi:MAG: ribosome biogenesis GTP-binding protein YihA/YsxC [Pseudomonadota bacterium]|nr:ribosome biogenesis GTP-binding protein YihA/YsxC [Pseudomonadota bacterium]